MESNQQVSASSASSRSTGGQRPRFLFLDHAPSGSWSVRCQVDGKRALLRCEECAGQTDRSSLTPKRLPGPDSHPARTDVGRVAPLDDRDATPTHATPARLLDPDATRARAAPATTGSNLCECARRPRRGRRERWLVGTRSRALAPRLRRRSRLRDPRDDELAPQRGIGLEWRERTRRPTARPAKPLGSSVNPTRPGRIYPPETGFGTAGRSKYESGTTHPCPSWRAAVPGYATFRQPEISGKDPATRRT
jgi:hypothetical protein